MAPPPPVRLTTGTGTLSNFDMPSARWRAGTSAALPAPNMTVISIALPAGYGLALDGCCCGACCAHDGAIALGAAAPIVRIAIPAMIDCVTLRISPLHPIDAIMRDHGAMTAWQQLMIAMIWTRRFRSPTASPTIPGGILVTSACASAPPMRELFCFCLLAAFRTPPTHQVRFWVS